MIVISCRGVLIAWAVATYFCAAAVGEGASGFRGVLDVAGVGAERLAGFGKEASYGEDDWSLVAQLLHRLRQYPKEQLVEWSSEAEPLGWFDAPADHLGTLCEVSGVVESMEVLAVPEEFAQTQRLPNVYHCRFRSESPLFEGVLLTREIPRRWKTAGPSAEPVRFRGMLLKVTNDAEQREVLFLANRLEWFPRRGVATGQLLLARHGMDAALFDAIVHRQPFVRPEISRESEAFYGCLAALGRVEHEELVARCRENVAAMAEKWAATQIDLKKQHKALQKKLAQAATPEAQKELQKEKATLREQRSVAAAIIKQSQQGLSSLGPLFTQPDEEVGQLLRLEGVARRAVRIVVPERPEIGEYFEIEIFTPEAKYLENRPVVCCVNRLPADFPQGDMIREPVRITGVFFKSWRYRTRDVVAGSGGETERQRRLYTPLILADEPRWIRESGASPSPWGLWAGVAFLLSLAALWLKVARSARRDRLARAAARPEVTFPQE